MVYSESTIEMLNIELSLKYDLFYFLEIFLKYFSL